MRERGAQKATMQMGWQDAKDLVSISCLSSKVLPRVRNHRISSSHATDERRRPMVVERPFLAAHCADCGSPTVGGLGAWRHARASIT
jgi:hypothetical protein